MTNDVRTKNSRSLNMSDNLVKFKTAHVDAGPEVKGQQFLEGIS